MLNVYYDKPIGYITEEYMVEDGTYKFRDIQLYASNAMLAMIFEYHDENGELMRELYGFFCDKAHMENCFGFHAHKGYSDSNIYDCRQHHWVVFAIDKTQCRDYNTIVKAVAKAFDNINIRIFSTGVSKD